MSLQFKTLRYYTARHNLPTRGFIYRFALIALSFVILLSVTGVAHSEDQYPYIVGKVTVPGFVSEMIVPVTKSQVLFAAVIPDGMPKAEERYGLYVFDISDPSKPRELSYYRLERAMGLAVASDGATLFILNTWSQGQEQDAAYGIHILDVSDPSNPRLLNRIEVDSFKMHVTRSGRLLFFEERKLRPESKKGLQIYDVSIPQNPRPLPSINLLGGVFGLTTTPDEQALIVRDTIDQVLIFNIKDPASPQKILEQRLKPLGSVMVARGTRIYTNDSQIYSIYSVREGLQEVATFKPVAGSTNTPYVSEDERRLLFTSSKAIHELDISDASSPKEIGKYPVPTYVGSVLLTERDPRRLILAGLSGSIVAIDPARAGVTADGLLTAHKRALMIYNNLTSQTLEGLRAIDALAILEAAGIHAALKTKPKKLSNRQYAYILNDYAFFLSQDRRFDDAITALKTVIKADPTRAVAYLNLGDTLRTNLENAKSYKEKVSATKDIKKAYRAYKKLSGKSTDIMESFFRLNLVDTPPQSVCDYITSYVNAGRFHEVFGGGSASVAGGSTHIDIDGDGKRERVQITYEGTAGYPSITVYTSDGTSYAAADTTEELFAGSIGLVPFGKDFYVLYYKGEDYPVRVSSFQPATLCSFVNEPEESIGEASEDKPLCKVILSQGHPDYIRGTEDHQLDPNSARLIETSAKKVAMIDVENDGKKMPIIELEYASGAGPGCDYDYFDLLNLERTDIATGASRDLLVSMQRLFNKAYRHPVPRCGGNETGWFYLNGVNYYETKYRGKYPSDAFSAFHEISYIKDKTIHRACEFSFKPKTRPE